MIPPNVSGPRLIKAMGWLQVIFIGALIATVSNEKSRQVGSATNLVSRGVQLIVRHGLVNKERQGIRVRSSRRVATPGKNHWIGGILAADISLDCIGGADSTKVWYRPIVAF
jgi:hypothetical protein